MSEPVTDEQAAEWGRLCGDPLLPAGPWDFHHLDAADQHVYAGDPNSPYVVVSVSCDIHEEERRSITASIAIAHAIRARSNP